MYFSHNRYSQLQFTAEMQWQHFLIDTIVLVLHTAMPQRGSCQAAGMKQVERSAVAGSHVYSTVPDVPLHHSKCG